jgi:hypothetical protein
MFDENIDSDIAVEGDETSQVTDHNGKQLPGWFIKRLRNCEMNGSFLQNAIVNHRVILNCQVEILRETSSYAVSRKLRSFIYKIILSSQTNDVPGKTYQDICVVEYDRQGKETKKFLVKPVDSLLALVPEIPLLEEIPDLSRIERRNMLYAAFDVDESCFDETFQESTQLLLLVLSMWVKFAQPKVTESHLSALIISVIALHMKELEWLNMKKSLGYKPYEPDLYIDIVNACSTLPSKKAEFFKKHIEKHFSRPEHSAKIPRDNKVVHGFAQFQTCFLYTMYLNQVLLKPVCMPSPSMILNCTFVYNLCRDLEGRLHSELFCADILGRGSSLHTLFLSWKQKVIELCNDNCFEATGLGVKKKNKSKGKKTAKVDREERKETLINSEKMEDETVTLNCDVSNKFSLLDLSDSF